jgi:hypothetical protein
MLVGLTLASIPASDREDAVSLSLIENRKQLGLEIRGLAGVAAQIPGGALADSVR